MCPFCGAYCSSYGCCHGFTIQPFELGKMALRARGAHVHKKRACFFMHHNAQLCRCFRMTRLCCRGFNICACNCVYINDQVIDSICAGLMPHTCDRQRLRLLLLLLQGMLVTEMWMDRVARMTDQPLQNIRQLNLYKEKDKTHFGQILHGSQIQVTLRCPAVASMPSEQFMQNAACMPKILHVCPMLHVSPRFCQPEHLASSQARVMACLVRTTKVLPGKGWSC